MKTCVYCRRRTNGARVCQLGHFSLFARIWYIERYTCLGSDKQNRTGRNGELLTFGKHDQASFDVPKNDYIVTTFIDFFRLPHDMPHYEDCMKKPDKIEQIQSLEAAINEAIDDRRFFSYIQLHEFEALLFSSNKGFEYYFSEELAAKTASIISSYDNPEDINTSPEGAPSKRLLAIKSGYNKVLEGNLIALEIGIKSILEKCPRFAEWIKTIIEKSE